MSCFMLFYSVKIACKIGPLADELPGGTYIFFGQIQKIPGRRRATFRIRVENPVPDQLIKSSII